jgi:imidazolonepropionase-like amidohydrolase
VRRILFTLATVAAGIAGSRPTQAPEAPTAFHLFFLGHDIGRETDDEAATAEGSTLVAMFHFLDRSTAVDLTGSLTFSQDHVARRMIVKGRNYRLFTSDSDVSMANGRAHVRDGAVEREMAPGARPFFPVDNYAPIGFQQELIRYWLARGRPAEIVSAPSGPVRITSRGREVLRRALPAGSVPAAWSTAVERLAVEGVVWGTETAWIDADARLVALTTWAGALPFEAVREGYERDIDGFIARAAADRVDDLEALTRAISPAAGTSFALVGATLVDGTERPAVAQAVVVVRDGRIVAVGPAATTPVPAGVPRMDVTRMTIVPGLWDMHAHASQVDWAPVYLAGGVTTIRDMGGESAFLIAFRDAVASGQALGPRVLLAGLVDGPGPQAFGAVTAATPEEGVAVTRWYHDAGFEQMKIYDYVAPDVVTAIVGEAHRLGMTVTGHVPRGMTAQGAVDAGFDQLAHMRLNGQSGSGQSRAQLTFFKEHGTVMDPTQSWNELGGHPASTPVEDFLPGVTRLPAPLARMFASMPGSSGDPAAIHARLLSSLHLLRDAVDAGVRVVAGTDKGVPGFSLQREIELYVEGGMTPLQAIQAATIVPARVMGLAAETGSVEVGKRADLVVLDGNPLERIEAIGRARFVVAAGRLYDCTALWRAAGYRPN